MSEQYSKWEPALDSGGRYYLYGLYERQTGLELVFVHTKLVNKKMRLLFNGAPFWYAYINESLALHIVGALAKDCKSDFQDGHTFFMITHVNYEEKWLPCIPRVNNFRDYKHFLFVTSEQLVSVVFSSEPFVEWIIGDLPMKENNDE